MLDGFRQILRDRTPRERRGRYSVRKHVSRLHREGRLPQIGLAVVAVLTIGGLAFGQCDASSIAGPSPVTETTVAGAVTAGGSVNTSTAGLGAETFRDNTVNREFVFTGINPCNGEPVIARGRRHDRIAATVSASGSFDADHHLNDAFKSVAIDAQGLEVTDPELEYVGGDVHNDRMSVNFLDGTTSHRELTNERLSRRGGGDHWVLHLDQRTEFTVEDPEPKITIKGHASCPPTSRCSLADGCPDRTFSVTSLSP